MTDTSRPSTHKREPDYTPIIREGFIPDCPPPRPRTTPPRLQQRGRDVASRGLVRAQSFMQSPALRSPFATIVPAVQSRAQRLQKRIDPRPFVASCMVLGIEAVVGRRDKGNQTKGLVGHGKQLRSHFTDIGVLFSMVAEKVTNGAARVKNGHEHARAATLAFSDAAFDKTLDAYDSLLNWRRGARSFCTAENLLTLGMVPAGQILCDALVNRAGLVPSLAYVAVGAATTFVAGNVAKSVATRRKMSERNSDAAAAVTGFTSAVATTSLVREMFRHTLG